MINGLKSDPATIGLILTERLINMPSEVTPPIYKMLLEEIQWAVEEKEPYTFTHFLILSKTYQEMDSAVEETDDSNRKNKKRKIKSTGGNSELFYFHPEDEVLQKHAVAFGGFVYVKDNPDSESDSKTVTQELGISPKGHMILIEAGKFEGAITEMRSFFGQS